MRSVLGLFVGLVVLAPACKSELGLDITLPKDLAEQTEWFEVGAFKDASCAAVEPMLANGLPSTATGRVAFKRNEQTGPKFGELPGGTYAFAAVARDKECTVLAIGCTEEDVNETDAVVIGMRAAEGKSGKCPAGASCQAATCVPANDNNDPSIGAGCSLELLGAGPLARPTGGAGTVISAPAIAPSPNGFVIVYREIDGSGSSGRITVLPIDSGGGSLTPQRPPLPAPCADDSDDSDGVGLVVNNGVAMMALAKPPCGGTAAELQLLNFRAGNDGIAVGKFFVSPSPRGGKVVLGHARASALRPNGSLVVFAEGGVGQIANMDPERGIVGPNGTFGGTAGIRDAWVAANDKVLALLAAGRGTGGGGGDAGPAPAPDDDSTLRLLLLPSSTAVDAVNAQTNAPRAPVTFPGVWASIAAIGGRVIVMSDGTGPGRSVSYRAYDLNKDEPADLGGFSIEGSERVPTGDVFLLGDRAYFAALREKAVVLHVFANATTKLIPLRDVAFGNEPRISAISTVRDGRVAVTATDSRVAVAWTTARELTKDDAAGGYAVFGCTQ
jgi:hypothetical protein